MKDLCVTSGDLYIYTEQYVKSYRIGAPFNPATIHQGHRDRTQKPLAPTPLYVIK